MCNYKAKLGEEKQIVGVNYHLVFLMGAKIYAVEPNPLNYMYNYFCAQTQTNWCLYSRFQYIFEGSALKLIQMMDQIPTVS